MLCSGLVSAVTNFSLGFRFKERRDALTCAGLVSAGMASFSSGPRISGLVSAEVTVTNVV